MRNEEAFYSVRGSVQHIEIHFCPNSQSTKNELNYISRFLKMTAIEVTLKDTLRWLLRYSFSEVAMED